MENPTAPWTEAGLRTIVDNQVEESLELEYKAGEALDGTDRCKDEITKDVSAFANAAGGTIIYGISETNVGGIRRASELKPVDAVKFSKERLDQVINTIRPRIKGLTIIPVAIGERADRVCYVVIIPQSTTAHQARDRRYYRRRNFMAEPMDDYEIRDIMLREKHPTLRVRFGVLPMQKFSGLRITIENTGRLIAHHVCAYVRAPGRLKLKESANSDFQFKLDRGQMYYETYLRNIHYDLVGRAAPPSTSPPVFFGRRTEQFYAGRYDPILPLMFTQFSTNMEIPAEEVRNGDDHIEWTLYADSAVPVSGKQALRDIEID